MENFSNADFDRRPQQPRQLPFISIQPITADIVFGSPRDDCSGTGICKIEANCLAPSAAASPRACSRAAAVLTAPDAHSLTISFRRTDLCSHLFSRYFRKEYFHLPQNCPLSSDLAQMLCLAGDELRAGAYPIEWAGDFCRITLRV